jgi:hypothetical protein
MFDTTGLFVDGGGGTWVAAPNSSAFYSTEIAAHRRFVESVVMQLASVVSRKIHGSAGTFDINLPSSGSPGIECRSGGLNNDHTIVFTFTNAVSVQNATVTAGTGSATNFTVAGNVVTVNLTGVTNAQTITVTLAGVSDGTNTSDVEAAMGVLVGDVNGDGFVNVGDTVVTKSQSGNVASGSNFRDDVNTDGVINVGDTVIVKGNSGNALSVSRAAEKSTQSTHIAPLDRQTSGIDKTDFFKWNKLRKDQ